MVKYLIKRLGITFITLCAISFLIFAIIQAPPGDYLTTYINELQSQGEAVDPQKIAFLREQYGLDKSFFEQYFMWVSGLIQGDLGYSFEFNQPVSHIIGERLELTALVSFSTLIFIWIISFPIAIYSATHPYNFLDYILTLIGFFGLAIPSFLLALILLYLSNVFFDTSIGGLMDPIYIDQPWNINKFLSVLSHLWVPVVVIGTSGTAAMIRRLRANLLDELQKPYVVTAKAKGLRKNKLLIKYPLRLSLNPFIADIGSILPDIVSGAVVVSAVLSLPTTGPMLLQALLSQDMYLAGSFLMFLAVLTIIGMFISDILLALLDPRIRLGGVIKK
ncbi:MAG: ABC transporter permease [Alphaproteobacteria bacterium]|nr:ABC transporter permease [Alphaproteobacteria bacterium]